MTNRRTIILWVAIVAVVMVKAYPTAQHKNRPGVEVKNKVEDEVTYRPGTALICETTDGKLLLVEYNKTLKPGTALKCETTNGEILMLEYGETLQPVLELPLDN
ncbi:TrV7 [Tranosema rostrale ichnovirus]|nr:TrV7 [Tranosema rostrale ichnovirus]